MSAAETCVCSCGKMHPAPGMPSKCGNPATTFRMIYAAGVGNVALPLCIPCDIAWAHQNHGTPTTNM